MFSPDDIAHIREAHAVWSGIAAPDRDGDALYSRWWAAPRGLSLPDEPLGTPPLSGRLRLAHPGTRIWLGECRVVAVGQADTVVVKTPDGGTRALSRGDHWTPGRPGLPARVGDVVVGVDRSGGYEADGWWRAWGGGWDLTRTAPDVTRIYLTVAPERILDVARKLPPVLDGAGISWTLKTPSSSLALARTDAAVCYFHDVDRGVATPLVVAAMADSLAPGRTVPFTAALAHGISWAEDPGSEDSFGQWRCRLLHDAFRTGGDAVAAAGASFEAAGLDPARPHLRGEL